MTEIPIFTALWLGILTSISPCPLATNIAAISFVGKKIEDPKLVFLAGLFYTAGRAFTYAIIGTIVISSLLSLFSLSFFLQKYMNMALGPILFFTGLILLGVIPLNFSGFNANTVKFQERVQKKGLLGAGLLGILFAVAFCPTSAALFFGSLLPIAIDQNSKILLPAIYGVGTALPVLFFAILIALSFNKIGTFFNKLTLFEIWMRKITAIIFILVGIYHSLTNIFGINFYS